jgi:hypothetical protein
VLSDIRIHESWLDLAVESMLWGEYNQAKLLLQEVSIHSRILKDQASFAKALMHMSTIKYLEGESGTALKLDMQCHSYVQDIDLMEETITHTYDLLAEFAKVEDAKVLLDGSLAMLKELQEKPAVASSDTGKKKRDTYRQSERSLQTHVQQNNLPLENTISTCLILKATLLVDEASRIEDGLKEKEALINQSFVSIDRFLDQQLVAVGCKQVHLERLTKFAVALQGQVGDDLKNLSSESIEFARLKLEKSAKILLKIQEQLTDQMYYIGIHQDSAVQASQISLPIQRMLGVVKLRLAQINTEIGVIKNTFKQSAQALKPGQTFSAADVTDAGDGGATNIQGNLSEAQLQAY